CVRVPASRRMAERCRSRRSPDTKTRMKLTLWALLGTSLVLAACDSSTQPSENLAAPSIIESFKGTLAGGGLRFYWFVVGARGTVNVTLNSLTVGGDAFGSTVGLAIGTPNGTGCADINQTTAGAGTTPQLTNSYNAATYCVRISDSGNLT